MRKAVRTVGLLGALMLIGATGLQGQDITIGVKGGLNVADLSIDDPAEDISLDSRTALVLGGWAQFGIGEIFAIQPELLYSQKGAKESDVGFDAVFKLSYFEVPVLLKARIPIEGGGVSPSIYAGGVVSFETKCEVEVEGEGISASADCDSLGDIGEEGIDTKSADFGLAFGADLSIPAGPVNVVGDVRYTLGLTDINDTATAELIDIKNRSWSFFIGLGFPLGL